MISVEEARQLIDVHVAALEGEEIPLADAWGRILLDPATSDGTYPSGDRSMMDGYAIGGDEVPGRFRLMGEVSAGAVPDRALGKGETMRIFTGALLPEGGRRVVMQEDVKIEGDEIVIDAFSENRFVRKKGCEAKHGDAVLAEGSRLGGAELAILAQIGMVRPCVARRPVVRHLATGNELVGPEQKPSDGQIRDTNSSLLAGLLREFGVDLTDSHRVADEPEALQEIAEGDWDLLLVSGGASVGDYDFGAETLRRLGFEIHFDKVNLRPGKPLTFATRGRQVAFVIPGNPVSHFVCFHVAIRHALEKMTGSESSWHFLSLKSGGGEPLEPNARDTFWPAKVYPKYGELVVSPVRWSTSGDTFSLAGVNALVRVHPESHATTRLQTLLLDPPVGGR